MKHIISKSIRNVPLQEVNNFCIEFGCELDVKEEEVILLEVMKNE